MVISGDSLDKGLLKVCCFGFIICWFMTDMVNDHLKSNFVARRTVVTLSKTNPQSYRVKISGITFNLKNNPPSITDKNKISRKDKE